MSRTKKTTSANSEPTYGAAAARLEEILGTIEEGGVDIDALSGLVKEAAELVTLCRGKILAAEVQVKTITEQLERETEETSPSQDEPGALPEDMRY